MLSSYEYLKSGNDKQKEAYIAICELNIMIDLAEYNPVLCGTIPIQIDLTNSDLDIIMEVHDFERFQKKITTLYHDQVNFRMTRTKIRGSDVVKANFFYNGFEFELFGQAQPVHKQHAYLHMVIEETLLKDDPSLREDVMKLKEQGYKTEPAFCKVLGITGDPYNNLIIYGKDKGIL